MRKILKGLTIFGILILFAALTPDCVKAADYAGTTTITAKTCDGSNVQSSCTIMVKPSKTQINQYILQAQLMHRQQY